MTEQKKANAFGSLKELYIKLQLVILFQGVNQLNTELYVFYHILKGIMRLNLDTDSQGKAGVEPYVSRK